MEFKTETPSTPPRRWLTSLASNPISSYVGILLLQLKVIWGMWWYKDLTGGDTSSYFVGAAQWVREWRGPFLWSPLYTFFYSLPLRLSSDAYTATIMHRVFIDLLLAVLVLALMRQLLSPGLAWMMAAWWAILPVDFNSLYEVHLFTLIPLLLGILAPVWKPGPYGRGLSVALFLVTTALMRQEYLVATSLMAILAFGWESIQAAKGRLRLHTLLAAYALPLIAASILIWFFFAHSSDTTLASVTKDAARKNSFNVCQLFAFGYQQRSSDFQGNAFAGCGPLMKRFFGSPNVGIVEATVRNPAAMVSHFLWNLRQAPAGIQIALFNARGGGINPDYVPTLESPLVWIPTLIVCGLVTGSLFRIRRGTQGYRLLSQSVWCWIALLCCSAGAANAVLLANARPATLFILAIAIRAATGLGFQSLLERWPRLASWSTAASVLLIVTVFLLPSIYQWRPSPRPLLQAYRRLKPAKEMFAEPGATLVSTEFGGESIAFFGHVDANALRFDQLRDEAIAGRSFGEVLNERGATLFLADERTIGDPVLREFIADPGAYHWAVLSQHHSASENWSLFHYNGLRKR